MNHEPTGFFVVIVDGDPDVGETITARPQAIKDNDGIRWETKAYQWLRDGEPIPGATQETYTVTPEDLGTWLTCEWSYTDGAGHRETVTSRKMDSYVVDHYMETLRPLYRFILGRTPDVEGLVFWGKALRKKSPPGSKILVRAAALLWALKEFVSSPDFEEEVAQEK